MSRSREEQQQAGDIERSYLRGGQAKDANSAPEPIRQFAAMCGTDAPTYTRDRPGMSSFVLEDQTVYHTYSAYARGLDGLCGAYQWPRPRTNGPQMRRQPSL